VSVATAPANPFAQDVEQPLPDPTTLVIFGAGGDLAARKLLPAVYNLLLAGLLPERMRVLGVARRQDVHSFRKTAREAI
jgi:glucose-6-phosphate 1-dehydrogenase